MSKKRKGRKKQNQSKATKSGVPNRKISETLIDFASPILDSAPEGVTAEELKKGLVVAVTVWNAVVIEEWGFEQKYFDDIHKRLRSNPESAELIEALVERKRKKFAGDLRAISDFDVKVKKDGTFSISAEARIKESLLKVQ